MHDPQLRIAWFSDLSKGRPESLSTYCSRLLLPEISRRHSIEVFSDSFSSREFGLPNHHYLTAYQRHRDHPYDLFFYQLEDGRYCRFVRSHIGLIPGVVWVHDLLCQDRGPEACHTSPWEQTIKQFKELSLGFSDRSHAAHQLWPQLYREVSISPVVLFSSDSSHREFLRLTSDRLEALDGGHHSQVIRVPVARVTEPRQASQVLRIACASEPTIEGRVHKLLPVLSSLQSDWRLVWMVSENEREAAREVIQEFGVPDNQVELRSPRDPALWQDVVNDSDIAVHLATGSFGHLAPYLQLSMASGCPVMVSQIGQGDDTPSDVAFKILPGSFESAQIQGVIEAVSVRGSENFAEPGVTYSSSVCDPVVIAEQLSSCLMNWVPQVSYVMNRWDRLLKQARDALFGEVRHLVNDTGGSKVDPYKQIIEPALSNLGWK